MKVKELINQLQNFDYEQEVKIADADTGGDLDILIVSDQIDEVKKICFHMEGCTQKDFPNNPVFIGGSYHE